jgi:hypothetical protein
MRDSAWQRGGEAPNWGSGPEFELQKEIEVGRLVMAPLNHSFGAGM